MSLPRSTIRVRTIDPGTDQRWHDYVAGDDRAGAYHLGEWAEILKRSYGYRPAYLAAEEDGTPGLAGVLPLLHGRGLMGSRLTSMPVAWSAGPLGTRPEIESTLLHAAKGLAEARGIERLLIRSRLADVAPLPAGFGRAPYAPAWELPLAADDDLDARWRTDKRLWRGLKKAQKSGLVVREGDSESDLRAFYGLYLETMRKHKSLPRSHKQMALARERMGQSFRLFVVEHEREVVAGGVFYVAGRRVELIYNASTEKHLSLRPNHALYGHAIRWAQEQGATSFDFGGAGEGTSLAEFKQQWGAEERPVYVYGPTQGLPSGGPAAEGTPAPGGPQVERVWAKAPLKLTQFAGELAYRFL